MRPIDADLLGLTDIEIIMCDGDYKKALKMLIDKIEHAPPIEPESSENAIKTIIEASFTGKDGLDYVETLVALNALKMRETGEWQPYTYVAPDDWYQDKEIRYRCSKCGEEVRAMSNFCPHCGVNMRGMK